jgi:hypothetical protein
MKSDDKKEVKEEIDRLVNFIYKERKFKPAKYHHECYEWDFLEIDEYSQEFQSCHCFEGDIRMDFYQLLHNYVQDLINYVGYEINENGGIPDNVEEDINK